LDAALPVDPRCDTLHGRQSIKTWWQVRKNFTEKVREAERRNGATNEIHFTNRKFSCAHQWLPAWQSTGQSDNLRCRPQSCTMARAGIRFSSTGGSPPAAVASRDRAAAKPRGYLGWHVQIKDSNFRNAEVKARNP